MDFPYGHGHGHGHRREEEERDEYPPPNHPQPYWPPPDQRVEQPYPIESHQHYRPPPPPHYNTDLEYQTSPPPPPPTHGFESQPAYPHVSHSHSHDTSDPESHHKHRPNFPFSIHHHAHEPASELPNKPTVRVYTKAEINYSLTIRDGQVILAPSDPNDHFQHWIKDEKYSTRVKDEEGFPCFSLVNKATGQALKHSIGATQPVQLVPYDPEVLDQSILWTESKDLGDGFRTIRMVNNIRLNLDAFNGDENHGGVHDGTVAVLWEWKKGANQRWKISPYCKYSMSQINREIWWKLPTMVFKPSFWS